MSGLDCAKILRQKFCSQKFHMYFITGYERSTIDEQYLSLVDGFMQKPIRIKAVQDVIAKAILNCEK